MDWNSSALWGIIGLIGGFIVSFIFYKIGNKNKKIVYNVKSQILITDNLSEIKDLNITYQDKPIKNLTTSTITIKSIGRDTVEMSDFGKATPLCVSTTGEFLLQDSINLTITENTNPNNLMKLVSDGDANILLSFDYLSRGDTIVFVLLHTGNLKVNGKLKAGTLLDNNIVKKINNVMEALIYIVYGLLAALVVTLYILSSNPQAIFGNIVSFLINLVLGIVLINYFKKLFTKLSFEE